MEILIVMSALSVALTLTHLVSRLGGHQVPLGLYVQPDGLGDLGGQAQVAQEGGPRLLMQVGQALGQEAASKNTL